MLCSGKVCGAPNATAMVKGIGKANRFGLVLPVRDGHARYAAAELDGTSSPIAVMPSADLANGSPWCIRAMAATMARPNP
jgi:hypothetical protein